MKKDKVEELADTAWQLIEEALTRGTITVGVDGPDPQTSKLSTDQIISLAQDIAKIKIKQPRTVNTPEDFHLEETAGEED